MSKPVSLEEKLKELSPESLARVNARADEIRAEHERPKHAPRPVKRPAVKAPAPKL